MINNLRIVWMVNRHFQEISDIDRTLYGEDDGYLVKDLREKTKPGNNKEPGYVGIVAQDTIGTVYGYCVYLSTDSHIMIDRLVVDPIYSHNGIGTKLINNIIDKTKSTFEQRKIRIYVPDDHLVGHLFLQKFGFVAIDMEPYKEHHRYMFEYENVQAKLT